MRLRAAALTDIRAAYTPLYGTRLFILVVHRRLRYISVVFVPAIVSLRQCARLMQLAAVAAVAQQ